MLQNDVNDVILDHYHLNQFCTFIHKPSINMCRSVKEIFNSTNHPGKQIMSIFIYAFNSANKYLLSIITVYNNDFFYNQLIIECYNCIFLNILTLSSDASSML